MKEYTSSPKEPLPMKDTFSSPKGSKKTKERIFFFFCGVNDYDGNEIIREGFHSILLIIADQLS